jgi:DNA-binding response OmpR family regulator
MTLSCPCCSAPLDRPSRETVIAALGLTRRERLVFELLWDAAPRPLTSRDIAEAIYGGREDGGPLSFEGIIRVFVFRLRTKLKGTGFSVIAGGDGRPIGYRLRIEDEPHA